MKKVSCLQPLIFILHGMTAAALGDEISQFHSPINQNVKTQMPVKDISAFLSVPSMHVCCFHAGFIVDCFLFHIICANMKLIPACVACSTMCKRTRGFLFVLVNVCGGGVVMSTDNFPLLVDNLTDQVWPLSNCPGDSKMGALSHSSTLTSLVLCQ